MPNALVSYGQDGFQVHNHIRVGPMEAFQYDDRSGRIDGIESRGIMSAERSQGHQLENENGDEGVPQPHVIIDVLPPLAPPAQEVDANRRSSCFPVCVMALGVLFMMSLIELFNWHVYSEYEPETATSDLWIGIILMLISVAGILTVVRGEREPEVQNAEIAEEYEELV
eukprot:410862_1